MSRPGVPQTTRDEPRVLLVVPETEWALALVQTLGRAGFESRALLSAESVAIATGHHRPAAVILDASFLAGDGYRLMETVRMSAPGIPVLVVAESTDSEMRSQALLMGADDCLVRPFPEREAVLRVRRAVERRDGLRRLSEENEAVRARAASIETESSRFRTRLLRHLSLIERGTDFHLRLDPDRGSRPLIQESLRYLRAQTGVDRLVFLGPEQPGAAWFTPLGSCGLSRPRERRLRLPARGALVSLIASGGMPVALDRLTTIPGCGLELGTLASAGLAAAAPVRSGGTLLGMVALGETRGGGVPDADTLTEFQFLVAALGPALAAVAGQERENAVQTETLGALVTRLEGEHPYLQGHSVRVAALAEDLAAEVGFRGRELTRMRVAGLLHDLGRLELDSRVWTLTGPLSPGDRELVHRHPEEGARLAAEAMWPDSVLRAIRHHHERWDGTGYPSGLAGEDIPIEARILAVADAYEAMISARPHRPALEPDRALARIRGGGGAQFDPALAAALGRSAARLRSA